MFLAILCNQNECQIHISPDNYPEGLSVRDVCDQKNGHCVSLQYDLPGAPHTWVLVGKWHHNNVQRFGRVRLHCDGVHPASDRQHQVWVANTHLV